MRPSKPKPESGADTSETEARSAAIRLLARREHSRHELRQKLATRGFPREIADVALESLVAEGLLSDDRFAESYVRARAERGYGPVRIRAELRERGIEEAEAAVAIEASGYDWAASAESVRRKRFGAKLPKEWKERARQSAFLQYRGFGGEQLRSLFDPSDD